MIIRGVLYILVGGIALWIGVDVWKDFQAVGGFLLVISAISMFIGVVDIMRGMTHPKPMRRYESHEYYER